MIYYTITNGIIKQHQAAKIDLKLLQQAVGGLIQPVYTDWSKELTIYANEEALNLNLKPNIFINQQLIFGNLVLVSIDSKTTDHKSCSLSMQEVFDMLEQWQPVAKE